MKGLCKCEEVKDLIANKSIIKWDPVYGWVLYWLELTEEEGFTQVHRYGLSIKYCPMCGGLLESL